MHLHQGRQAKVHRGADELLQLLLRKELGDYQDGVRAAKPALVKLILVHEKILPQYREPAGALGQRDILHRSLEKPHVGKHREGRRPRPLQLVGQRAIRPHLTSNRTGS